MNAIDKMYGLNQNIDLMFFEKDARLGNEFTRLYHSLFRHAGNHIRIVEILATNGDGMTRQQLSSQSGIADGGGLTNVLMDLESCGLISRIHDMRIRKSGEYYKLMDFYSLFYFKYLKNRKSIDPHFWTSYLSDPGHRAWCGYAFERLCMVHVEQIKQRLGISGVITEAYAFRSQRQKNGVQIDLIIDRRDDTINICECKYTNKPFAISEE